MSAREALAMALLRHIEGDDVTRDLITDDEWAGYLSDADYVSGLISAAGYAVVPREPTPEMCSMGAEWSSRSRPMSERATCETCRWWDKILGAISRPERGGYCHRNPPHAGYGWTHTNAEGWCGEHQPKPPHR